MQTQALVPHRDVVLWLSRFSKKIIFQFNKENFPTIFAVPVFPFWSFAEKFPDQVTQASILEPKVNGKNFYFPVELWSGEKRFESKIIFATINGETKNTHPNLDEELVGQFPLKVPCYKTGLAVNENNGWKLYNEKWVKPSTQNLRGK